MTAVVTAFPKPRRARVAIGLKPERVARLIRAMIIQDELTPGMPIRERALTEKLNVSRTPLREALKLLSAEGLVRLQPRRGAIVAAPSDAEVRDLLQLLGGLEGFAGALACEAATEEDIRALRALHDEMRAAYARGDRLGYFHLNQEIHQELVRATRNAALIEHHRMVNARVYRIRYISNLRPSAGKAPSGSTRRSSALSRSGTPREYVRFSRCMSCRLGTSFRGARRLGWWTSAGRTSPIEVMRRRATSRR